MGYRSAIIAAATLLLPASAAAQSPYEMSDDTWISISGTVDESDVDSFYLNYGSGRILVEMDDWDWFSEAVGLIDGDEVTVYGRIDDDFYETATIEARSVHNRTRGTYHYASAADEEGEGEAYDDNWITGGEVERGEMTVRGTVTSVDGSEFTIDTGERMIRVETGHMVYDPTDDTGFSGVDVGDMLSVTGVMDSDLFESRELMADNIVFLLDE